ncbi:MAG: hypothetical protein U1C96_03245 [Gallionella sp.]|nr:hypothetical protein [Gallionella sp.]
MGFVIIVAMGLYLLISLGVVASSVSHAKKNGKNIKLWGWSAALFMYLIPFWDWMPTVAVHQFYCAKDSGVWIYKTLDQWKTENPGVMESLTTQRVWPSKHDGDMKNYISTDIINQRFNYVFKKNGPLLFSVWRHEQAIFDSRTNEVLAKQIDFSTGNGNVGGEPELRFWMHSDNCFGGRDNAISFVKFVNQFRGAEK